MVSCRNISLTQRYIQIQDENLNSKITAQSAIRKAQLAGQSTGFVPFFAQGEANRQIEMHKVAAVGNVGR